MKHGNLEKIVSRRKSIGRTRCAWIWIAMALIVVAAAGRLALCVDAPMEFQIVNATINAR